MPAQRRRFTLEEKLEILQEAKQSGITAILRKHNLSYSVFHRWKDKLMQGAKNDLPKSLQENLRGRLKELVEENNLLKKIIANQAVLLELKEEELRKRKE
jgi:putative transposase